MSYRNHVTSGGQTVRWTGGQVVKRSDGQTVTWSNGQVVRWSNSQMVKRSGGQAHILTVFEGTTLNQKICLSSLSAELPLCLAIVPPLQVFPVLLAQTSQSWWGRYESLHVWQTDWWCGAISRKAGPCGETLPPVFASAPLHSERF